MPEPDYEGFTFPHPGTIDGSPEEVAERAVEQLAQASLGFATMVEATIKQVENAGRQAALENGVEVGDAPGALDEWWRSERPAQAARAEALRVVAERLPAGVRALHYALSRGE